MLDTFLKSVGQLLKLRPSSSAPTIPVYVVLAGAENRPGLSVTRSTANVIAAKRKVGLPTGNYPDGTPNYDDVLVELMFDELYRAIHEDARVTAAVPAGIQLQGQGPPIVLGGPVTVVGTTIQPMNAHGIIQ